MSGNVRSAQLPGDSLPQIRTSVPGPSSRRIAAEIARLECPSFEERRGARAEASGHDFAPIVYARAHGDNVEDADGNVLVDLCAGFGALALGHTHDGVTDAYEQRARSLGLALGDVYGSEEKAALCTRLAGLVAPGARVLFGLSGADAVTAALKTAVLATGRPGVVAFEGSYHGLSHGPLAACGLGDHFRAPFAAQLNPHVRFAPFPAQPSELAQSLSVVRAALASGEVGAVLFEPLLGRGGCLPPCAGFLVELRALCTEFGALLIADEVWTGLGRSGAMLDSANLADVVCLGKSLGAGVPISACVGRGDVMAAWGAHGGSYVHTSTHVAAPPACAAACVALDTIVAEQLPERAALLGQRMRAEFGDLHVTGRGLMLGVPCGSQARALAATRQLLARGYIVLTGGTRGDVLTLSPALNVNEALLRAGLTAVRAVLSESGMLSA